MSKRSSFIEIATDRPGFLLDDQGFAGAAVERPWDRIPTITRLRYHRGNVSIEVVHIVGFMGENHIQTPLLPPGIEGTR